MSGRDILYCTKEMIDLEAPKSCAESIGYRAYYSLTEEPELVIEFSNGSISWWVPEAISNMRSYLAGWQIKKIEGLNCYSFLQITCHKGSFVELRKLLDSLLSLYGGYVTCDSNFEILFDVQNINEFDCK